MKHWFTYFHYRMNQSQHWRIQDRANEAHFGQGQWNAEAVEGQDNRHPSTEIFLAKNATFWCNWEGKGRYGSFR